MTRDEWLTTDDPLDMIRHLTPRPARVDEACVLHLPVEGADLIDGRLRQWADTVSHLAGVVPVVEPNRFRGRSSWWEWSRTKHARMAQADKARLLRCVLGDVFAPVLIPWRCRECGIPCGPPAAGYYCVECGSDEAGRSPWLTNDVVCLAKAALDERTWCCSRCGKTSVGPFPGPGLSCPECHDAGVKQEPILDDARLRILSDALEEAGCIEACPGLAFGDVKIPCARKPGVLAECERCGGTGTLPNPLIAHLREGGPHSHACWAVRLLNQG